MVVLSIALMKLFLLVIPGEHISYKLHISQVARKISKSVGILYKLVFFFQSILYVSYALICLHLQCCIIVRVLLIHQISNVLFNFKSVL